MPHRLLPRSLAALATVAAIAVPVAGCGGSSASAGGDRGADPASVLPASTPIYAEARMRLSGTATNAATVGRKLLHGRDPGAETIELIDQALREDGTGRSYRRDIAPWVGERAGVAVTGFSGRRADAAANAIIALTSRDDAKAQAFVDRQPGTTKREYRGVTYRVRERPGRDGKLGAAAVVDGEVVIASEAGLKAAIDAAKGDALSDLDGFKEARGAVAQDGIGFLYVDPRRTFDEVSLQGGSARTAQGAAVLKGVLAAIGLRSIAVSVDVRKDAIVADAALVGMTPHRGGGDGPGASAAVPAGAWLSAGVGNVGGAIQRALKQWSASGAGGPGGFDPQAVLGQLKAGLGLDVQHDLLSWMGDAALFVEGTSRASLRGALVVHSTDPAASHRAIGLLERLLPVVGAAARPLHGLPAGTTGVRLEGARGTGSIQIAAAGDRFVIAAGAHALADALARGARLGSTPAYRTASGLLDGTRPSLFLDVAKVVRLAQALSGDSAGFRKAKATLEALGPAAAGERPEGGTLHLHAGVAVP